MTEPLYEAPSLSGTCVDMIFPQNLPSIVCSHILDPQPGETILDMCAAPGKCMMINEKHISIFFLFTTFHIQHMIL